MAWANSEGQLTTEIQLLPWEGAVLTLPIAFDHVTAGRLDFFDIYDNEPTAPGAPYSASIHLLSNLDPVDTSTFDEVVRRAPLEGDAVLQIDLTEEEQISRFVGGSWLNSEGQAQEPVIETGASAFFDLSGQQFSGFELPFTSVPEPSTSLLIAFAGFTSLRRRRD